MEIHFDDKAKIILDDRTLVRSSESPSLDQVLYPVCNYEDDDETTLGMYISTLAFLDRVKRGPQMTLAIV